MIHQFMYPKVTPVRPGTGSKPAAAPATPTAPRRAA